jgi:hypothetical protein
MPKPQLSVKDLTPEQLKQFGLKVPREHVFTKKSVRTWALKVLAVMAELTQDQRRRVLEHASKVNRL